MSSMYENISPKLSLFPVTKEVNSQGHLCIGGCDCVDLAKEFGTPLYVFDEVTIRTKCREFLSEFTSRYTDTLVIYASKAFLNPALATIIKEEGLGLDVVSGGELSVAHSVEFPGDKIYFHGNNKTPEELTLAITRGVGYIVVDNFNEIDLVNSLAGKNNLKQKIMLRLTPDVDPHTHQYTTTGVLDSKFGFPLATGQAEEAVRKALIAPNLALEGFHFHLGSPIKEIPPYQIAIDIVLKFASNMNKKYGVQLKQFSPGGGFAVKYTLDSHTPTIAEYAEAITSKLISLVSELGLPQPKLVIEPGRAIVAQAGVALYKVGAIKEIAGVRNYVCVDGGIGDNIRPALYGAKYEALVANKVWQEESFKMTIAGRYCESGDILAKDLILPQVEVGDIIAVPVSGAYSIPMSSNYNLVPRPAIVLVKAGKARLIRRRETYEQIMGLDLA